MNPLATTWVALQEKLYFLHPLADQPDQLVLSALLLVAGMISGEALHRLLGLSRIIGYVAAGALAGPGALDWLDARTLSMAEPLADTALGLLLLETGRSLDVKWLRTNRELLPSAIAESSLSLILVFAFSYFAADLSAGWSAATAAITMASAPAVVLLTTQENRAQGQVAQRTLLLTAINCALSFVVFAAVLGIVHAEQSGNWLNAVAHPLWVMAGGVGIGMLGARIALLLASKIATGAVVRTFALIATAVFTIGLARTLSVPVFLSLFMMGVSLNLIDRKRVLSYIELPDVHWILAIGLFVITGAMLPLKDLNWLTAQLAFGLIVVRGVAKFIGVTLFGQGDLSMKKRRMVGLGIQPLSATAIFMASEIASIYPEVGSEALLLPLLAAAMMEFVGPQLCRYALITAGECPPDVKGDFL